MLLLSPSPSPSGVSASPHTYIWTVRTYVEAKNINEWKFCSDFFIKIELEKLLVVSQLRLLAYNQYSFNVKVHYLENAPTLNETWTLQSNEENASPKNTFIRSFIVLVNTMNKYKCVAVLYLLSTDRIHLLAIFCLATKQRLRFIGRVNKPLGRKGH